MGLLVTYIALAIVGNIVIYFIGLLVEQVLPAASLIVYLTLFFVVLWVSWILSVKLTAPKGQPAA